MTAPRSLYRPDDSSRPLRSGVPGRRHGAHLGVDDAAGRGATDSDAAADRDAAAGTDAAADVAASTFVAADRYDARAAAGVHSWAHLGEPVEDGPQMPFDGPAHAESPGSALVRSVSAAYAAAHGHPAEHDTLVGRESERRRWALGLRAALAAAVALLVVAGVVVVRDLTTMSVEPVPVGEVDDAAPASGGAGTEDGDGGSSGSVSEGSEDVGSTSAAGDGSAGPEGGGDTMLVHVVGQVNAPGVVEIPAGSRVVDAVAAAGGTTADADTASVNLARLAVDGEQVYVPAPGEAVPGAAAVPGPGGGPAASDGPDGSGGALVNLNSAGTEELQSLPGVGPALAQRILDWRESNGAFGSVDQLLDVSGIGPVVLDGLRDLVTL